jgi:SPX domain protein involved in polyphosphate accumulation
VEKLLGSSKDIPETENVALKQKVEITGENFLKLEKYVNLNVTGFHKILKKHDRRLPNPCKAFYTRRLHDQSWVRGDYSDVIVAMSRVYSILRHDEQVEEVESEKQVYSFIPLFAYK